MKSKPISELPSLLIKCDCHTEALEISCDKRYKVFDICLWNQGHPSWGWGYRLKHIWKILRSGQPYGDCVILSEHKAKQLTKFITTHTK